MSLTPEQSKSLSELSDSLNKLRDAILEIHNQHDTTAESMVAMRRAFGMDKENG